VPQLLRDLAVAGLGKSAEYSCGWLLSAHWLRLTTAGIGYVKVNRPFITLAGGGIPGHIEE
jgi:hypothetical protein